MPPPTLRTQVIRVDPDAPDPAALQAAAAVIRAGGLVAFPTETVYGLGANALDPDAVRRIFVAKERAADDPLIVHVLDVPSAEALVLAIADGARALAAAFWPGPLTLVLPRRELIPPEVTSGLATVAIRAPGHPVARALLAASGVPIAAPSANRFMRTSATAAEHVLADLGGRIDLILDGGPTPFGVESTVVRFDAGSLRILRPGAVAAEAIARVLDRLDPPLILATGAGPGPAASPGMLAKHYAPVAPLRLLPAGSSFALLRAPAEAALAAGGAPGMLLPATLAESALAWRHQLRAADRSRIHVRDLGADAPTAAHRLFAELRDLDAAGVTLIIAVELPDAGIGRAINDRLRRAATPSPALHNRDP